MTNTFYNLDKYMRVHAIQEVALGSFCACGLEIGCGSYARRGSYSSLEHLSALLHRTMYYNMTCSKVISAARRFIAVH